MPNPVPENTVQAVFTAGLVVAGARQDEAQFGIWGVRHHETGNTVDWPSDCQDMAEKLVAHFNATITTKANFSPAVHMETCVVNHYEAATGKVLDQGQAGFTGGTAWNGSGTTSLPWETSVCMSLYGYGAEFVRDKGRKRGRFYLPPLAVAALSDASGMINDTVLGNLRDEFGAFLNAVQGTNFNGTLPPNDPDYWDLRVISRGTKLKPLAPTSTPIVRLQLDSKVDSQRRRERQQPGGAVASAPISHA